MAGQRVPAPQLGQHAAGNLAGVGPGVMRRDVLRAVPDGHLVGLHQGLHAAQRGEWRQHRDVGGGVVLTGQGEGELLRQRDRLKVVVMHLPVASHQRPAVRGPAHVSSSSAASPGSRWPSRYSRLAPPPVEMCEKSPGAKPSRRTAAAESPPPITVSPCTALTASATALVPAANAGNSKTPTGPFQKTVFASASFEANSSLVAGPISTPSRSAGKLATGTTSCSASGANRVAATRSTGSTISTPRRLASSSIADTCGIWSASSSDLPTSQPRAARNV